MFGWFKKECSMCKRKMTTVYKYIDRKGKTVRVCGGCASYAERRAFRKKSK